MLLFFFFSFQAFDINQENHEVFIKEQNNKVFD